MLLWDSSSCLGKSYICKCKMVLVLGENELSETKALERWPDSWFIWVRSISLIVLPSLSLISPSRTLPVQNSRLYLFLSFCDCQILCHFSHDRLKLPKLMSEVEQHVSVFWQMKSILRLINLFKSFWGFLWLESFQNKFIFWSLYSWS